MLDFIEAPFRATFIKPTDPGYLAVGGHEEAFDYWERMGKHWDSKSKARRPLEVLKSSEN